MREAETSIRQAVHAAADGLRLAQEHARFAAGNLAGGRDDLEALLASQNSNTAATSKDADVLRDIVELSEAAQAARASAGVFRAADGSSREIVNLGRRLDVKV